MRRENNYNEMRGNMLREACSSEGIQEENFKSFAGEVRSQEILVPCVDPKEINKFTHCTHSYEICYVPGAVLGVN